MIKELSPELLRKCCDESSLSFQSTEDLTPLAGIIGQERAVSAMEFGLKINHKGYNIFMTGITGTGKTSFARLAVTKAAEERPVPEDIVYVYNFEIPEKPIAIKLPAGKGAEFAKDMEKLIYDIRKEVPGALNDETFAGQKQQILDFYQKKSMDLISQLEDEAKKEGFALQKSSQGIAAVPLFGTKPMSQEEYDDLPSEKKRELENKSQQLQGKIDEAIRKIRKFDKIAKEKLDELEKNTALLAADPLFEDICKKYSGIREITEYLKAVKNDLIKNFILIKEDKDQQEENFGYFSAAALKKDFFIRYRVNLFVDNSLAEHAPVVFETNPTYYNLFGKIEGKAQFGTVTTDFTCIKSGAIHRANGGYLVLQAQDLLKEPFAWDALKRTLMNGEARIENIGQEYRAVPTVTLKPQPIPVEVKVILIGTPFIYSLLSAYDEDFRKLFKIKVDFDVEMDRTKENVEKYARLISKMVRDCNLLHFKAESVAEIVDYSSRLAQDKTKLSTRFNEILELLLESSTWAKLSGSSCVMRKHVQKAMSEKIYRSNRIEEKMLSMIKNGEIIIDTEGKAVGQVNGLSVLDVGDYVFGQPSRITARVYMGDTGVVNIEREAKLSGNIHDKAVMIITGYLGEKYARDVPLSISAGIAFEQNYGGIEGDSASCAELIALLSAVTRIPVRQDLAVTGSMDQHGNVQPVGGVTYKVEGFYHACKVKGLTGTQGVVIPEQNITNLMLKPEVVDAVKKGKFHIYSASTIDDVIHIMTGLSPRKFHFKVKKSLEEIAKEAKNFYDGEK